jgi:hypothetical protein
MPNWCNNILIIRGSHLELKKFYFDNKSDNYDINIDNYEQDNESCLSLNKSVPMPENIFKGNLGINERKKHGSNNWYDWSIQYWGTKWDIRDCDIYNSKNIFNTEYTELKYRFLTAWSPPLQWFEKIIYKYKNINFELEYIEEAMEFAGKISSIDGIVQHEQYNPSERLWKDYNKEKLRTYINNYLMDFIKNKINKINTLENIDYKIILEEIFEKFEDDVDILYGNEENIKNIILTEKNICINYIRNYSSNILNFFDSGSKVKNLEL